jgi:hypothetical protein
MKDYLASVRIECRLRAGEIDGGHKVTDAGVIMRALALADIEEIIGVKMPVHFPRNPEGAFNLLKLFPKVVLQDAVAGPIWESIYSNGKLLAIAVARRQALQDAGEMFEDFDMFRVEQALDMANAVGKFGADRLPAFESVPEETMLITGSKLISAALDALRTSTEPTSNRRYWEAIRRAEEAETYLKLIQLGHITLRDTREIALPPEELDDDENTDQSHPS